MEPGAPQEQFSFTDQRQERIYRRLSLIGPGPASFYKDACQLMNGNQLLDSTTHLVGHLLREIESALRAVLVPPKSTKEAGGSPAVPVVDAACEQHRPPSRKDQIRDILSSLGIAETSKIAVLWFSETLDLRAHRSALGHPRPVDNDFEQFWEANDAVLDAVLDCFEARYLDFHRRVEGILAETPSQKSAKRLRNEVPNNLVALGHFFDNLKTGAWLAPLKSEGFFASPPGPEHNAENNSVSFPRWPASQYLTRVAKDDPKQVCDIILAMLPTENISVHADVVDAALAMPADQAARLAPMASTWIGPRYQYLLPHKLGELISHLATNGAAKEALDLAKAVLAINNRDPVAMGQSVAAFMHDWEYRDILERHIPTLVDKTGQPAFRLLCDLLGVAIAHSYGQNANGTVEDYSSIWRGAIENQEQDRSVENGLVSAVRDAALQLGRAHAESIADIVQILESHQWLVFRRIALHVLSELRDGSDPLVADRICDQGNFQVMRPRHEYSRLVKRGFPTLSDPQKQVVLSWVEEGPDVECFKSRYKSYNGAEASDEQTSRYVKTWQRDHLEMLEAGLPHDWKVRYQEIVTQIGSRDGDALPEPAWPGLSLEKMSFVGAGQFQAMKIDELIAFLQSWEEPKDSIGHAKEYVGCELAAAVVLDPVRFAREAPRFRDLSPEYVTGLIRGLCDSIRGKNPQELEWAPIFDLCEWVITESAKEAYDRTAEESRNWRRIRQCIAELLESGFADGNTQIPIRLRDVVWKVLRPLTDDPDPTKAVELDYHSEGYYALAIQTVRGQAMHAVIGYASWVKRNIVNEMPTAVFGFDRMPEVREVMDDHLDRNRDASLAVRAIYGRFFPLFVMLDPAWAADNVARIFPAEEYAADLRAAAWDTYVTMCPAHDIVFPILEEQYAGAIGRIKAPNPKEGRRRGDPDTALAEHLMVLYWRGTITNEPRGILEVLFSQAPADVRGHALSFVGRCLKSTAGVIDEKVLKTLITLWEQRLEEANRRGSRGHDDEMSAFGWWFASNKLDDSWSVTQLVDALQIAGHVDADNMVAKRLAAIAALFPHQVVQAFRLMIEGDKKGWHVDVWRKEIREALATVISSGNEVARSAAIELINRLAARGRPDFRDLLP